MDFESSLGLSSSSLCTWSPNGRYIAVVSAKSRLVIRDAASLDVLKTEIVLSSKNDAVIDSIQFSPDSQFILASDFKDGVTFVYKTDDQESSIWKAKISEGMAGISDIRWSPDSRHIISLAEFSIKLTVWSLLQKLVRYIKFPKKKECISFSPNGHYLAVIERRENKDCLSLFSCSKDWGMAQAFELYPEMDSASIQWSPKSGLIAVSSSKLQCIVCVYALDGRCLFIYKPDEIGISMSSMIWSKCGNILAIATSQSLAVINCLTWSLIADVEVPVVVHDEKVNVLIEMEKPLTTNDVDVRVARELCRNPLDTEYVHISQRPLELLPAKRNNHHRRLPFVELEFSNDNKFLLATAKSHHICWIFDVSSGLKLDTVLVHQNPILKTLWSPKPEKVTSLMVLTNDGLLHVWTSKGALCLALPPLDQDYGRIRDVQWNPLGRALALTCQDGVVCCRVGKIK